MSTSLQTISNSLPPEILDRLTISEKRITSAMVVSEDNPRVGKLNSRQLQILVDNVLLKVSIRLGQKVDKSSPEYQIHIKEMVNDLFKFPGLTAREIYQATENGIDGTYEKPGEPVIFNHSKWVRWVKAYIEETKRPVMGKVNELKSKIADPGLDPITPEERYKRGIEILAYAFGLVSTSKKYIDAGNVLYNFLDEFGYIEADTEQKFAALKIASDEVWNELAKTHDRRTVKTLEQTLENPETIKSRAKNIILNNTLKSYLTDGNADKAIEFIKQMQKDVTDFLSDMPGSAE